MNFFRKNNNGKAVLIFVIILVVLALVGSVSAYVYFKLNVKEEIIDDTNKKEFFYYLANTNIEKILNTDEYVNIINRVENENNETATTVSINTNKNMWNGYDLNKATLEYSTKKDVGNSLNFADIKLKYANNDIISVQEIKENNKFAIKSDEIVNKYVGLDLNNLKDVLKKIGVITAVSIPENFDDIKFGDFLYLDGEYKESVKNKYKDYLYTQITPEKFNVQRDVIVNVDNKSYTTLAYNVVLNENEFKNLYVNILNEIKNDDELINTIAQKFQIIENKNITQDKIKSRIQKYIDEANLQETNDNEKMKLTLYINEENVIKIRCDIYNQADIEVDFISDNSLNKINMTYLENTTEEKNGLNINMKRDDQNNLTLDIGYISKGEVNKKIIIDFNIDGNSTSATIKNNLEISYKDSENNTVVKLENKVNFGNVNIDKLTDDNCLFLDSLSDEDLLLVRNSIVEKIVTVYKEKLTTLNIINNNMQSTVVSLPEQNGGNEENNIEQ